MPQLSIKGEDLNFLVYRYLVENGYQHSAFCFRNESNLPNYLLCPSTPSRSKPPKYPPQCLIGLIYKAILFIWVEAHTNQATGEEIPCDAPFNLFKPHVCSQGTAAAAATSDDLFKEEDDDDDEEEVEQEEEEADGEGNEGVEQSQSDPPPSAATGLGFKAPDQKAEEDASHIPLPSKVEQSSISPSQGATSSISGVAMDSPIPRKTSTPVDTVKKLKNEIKDQSMEGTQSPPSDNDEPISGYRRRRLFSHVRSMSFQNEEPHSDPQAADNSAKKLAVETPKKSGVRPGRPKKESVYQVIRRGPSGYVLGFRTDREQVTVGKKNPPEGWRISTVLTNSNNAIPKRVEVNSEGRLMVVLWLTESTKCYDCHLYEIDEADEFHFVKLGMEASQLMNIQAVKFSSSRPAFRIILAGRREGTSIFKTYGKHEDGWKLEGDVQHP